MQGAAIEPSYDQESWQATGFFFLIARGGSETLPPNFITSEKDNLQMYWKPDCFHKK